MDLFIALVLIVVGWIITFAGGFGLAEDGEKTGRMTVVIFACYGLILIIIGMMSVMP